MARIPALLLSMCLVVAALVFHTESQAQGPGGGGGGGGGQRGGGGPGGFFGGPGRNSSPSWLLTQEPVQEDLKLSDEQKSQLKTFNQKLDEQRKEMFSKNQDGARPSREEMRANFEAMNEQTNTGIAKILKKDQRVRLNQISLQQEGPLAVARPEIAEKLNMSPEQMEQIQGIMDQAQEARRELFMSMRGGRGFGGNGGGPGGDNQGGGGQRGGGRQGRGQGNNNNNTPKQANTQTAQGNEDASQPAQAQKGQGQGGGGQGPRQGGGGPGGFNRDSPEAKAQFAKMREEGDKIQQQTIAMVSKVLSKKQKLAFNKMLGEPFDFDKLTPGNGGPRPNGSNTKAASKTNVEATSNASASAKKKTTKSRKNAG